MSEFRPFAQVVDGLELPAFVAGHPALDFCNTFAGWNGAPDHDYLATFAHVVTLTRAAGLLGATTAEAVSSVARGDPHAAAGALARAVRLRAALYAICTSEPGGAGWGVVKREVRSAHALLELVPGSPARLELPAEGGLATPQAAIALAAVDLLTRVPLDTVGCCPGRGCGWLFVDPTRRRRWCTMAVCGNREKARRHAARQRQTR